MAGYTRQSSILDGETGIAALWNDEYNQLVTAFHANNGHKHDGSAAEGPVIGLIGDASASTPKNKVVVNSVDNRVEVSVSVASVSVEQIRVQDGAVLPTLNNDIDLGSSSFQFKNAYFDGDVTCDGFQIGASTVMTNILDEDNMASNSATSLATQQSIKAYVDTSVGAVDLSDILAVGNSTGAADIVVTSGQKITTNTIAETTAAAGVTIDGVLLKDGGVTLNAGAAVNSILDQDDMLSNSATALATQQSIKAYADTKQVALISGTNIKTVNSTSLLGSGDVGVGVTSVAGAGTVNGLNITGTVTSTGSLTLGGTLSISNTDWSGTDLSVANGGTGRSTFGVGNLITGNGTSGLNSIAPGNQHNLLTSTGSVWSSTVPRVAPVPVGIVIGEGISVVTLASQNYDNISIHLDRLRCTTDHYLYLIFSVAESYDVGTNYRHQRLENASSVGATGQTAIPLCGQIGGDVNEEGLSITIWLGNPTTLSKRRRVNWVGSYVSTAGALVTLQGSGEWTNTADLPDFIGVILSTSPTSYSGSLTWASGSIKAYGYN